MTCESKAVRSVWLVTMLVAALTSLSRAADEKAWATQGYRVRIHLAIDSSANPGTVTDRLASQLEQQIHRTLYPFWRSDLSAHVGSKRSTLLQRLDQLGDTEVEFETGTDKTLFLVVAATPDGTRLSCRELDSLTGRWTPVITRETRQELLLTQHCLELLCETFAPRAIVRIDPQNEEETALAFMGAQLLSEGNEKLLTRTAEIFQPFLVRTNRAGSTVGNVLEVPWTYLVTEEAENDTWRARVYSGTRRPFGARRRAGIDVVALEIKPVAEATRVRFHAVHDKSVGLAGYEVFEKAANGDEFQPAGFTDQDGSILVRRGDFPITLVTLRSDSQPLVQVPVAAGASREMQIPVSDDAARLLVQETLTTFKEQLVDIVARRNILMARARNQLHNGKTKEARELIAEIGDLPTRANLDRYLATLERDPASKSENQRVQAKIDRMFADSRKLMSTYLTTRELMELQSEVNNSQNASSQ